MVILGVSNRKLPWKLGGFHEKLEIISVHGTKYLLGIFLVLWLINQCGSSLLALDISSYWQSDNKYGGLKHVWILYSSSICKEFLKNVYYEVLSWVIYEIHYIPYFHEYNRIHCVAKVYAVLPFYDVKCLCSGGREWGREESHSH